MTDETCSFSGAIALEGEGQRFYAQVHPSWAQGRATFGGLVGALMLRALERALALAPERRVRSLTVDFVGPVAPGSVELSTRVLRSGKTLTHAYVELIQGGEVCANMTAVFGGERPSALVVEPGAPAVLPEPDAISRIPYVAGMMPSFAQYFDFRYASAWPFSGKGDGTLAGYVRHTQPTPLDGPSLLALIDAWPPAVLAMLTRFAFNSSVTWMVDFLADFPPDSDHAYVRYDARTVHARAGYASAEARVWSDTGVLLAASRQLSLEFS